MKKIIILINTMLICLLLNSNVFAYEIQFDINFLFDSPERSSDLWAIVRNNATQPTNFQSHGSPSFLNQLSTIGNASSTPFINETGWLDPATGFINNLSDSSFHPSNSFSLFIVLLDSDPLSTSGLLLDNFLSNGIAEISNNLGFETGTFEGWETLGEATIVTDTYGASPTEGSYQALLTTGAGSASLDDLYNFSGKRYTHLPGMTEVSALKIDFIAPVPEPATLILLGTGLVGLVGCRKKFKK